MADPRILAHLGAAAGFLDPNGGIGAGFQGAINGYMAGNNMRNQSAMMQMQQAKMKRDMIARGMTEQIMSQHAKEDGTFDHKGAISALMATGMPEVIAHVKTIQSALPQYKAKYETRDATGKPRAMWVDTYGEAKELPGDVWKAPIKVDQGGATSMVDPGTMAVLAQYRKTMSPDAAANLGQRRYEFGMNYNLDRDKFALDQYRSLKPEFRDGYFITPPSKSNPTGGIVPTDLASPPKGSAAEVEKLKKKVSSVLGDDTKQLINSSTGSYLGQARDFAGRIVGHATDPAKALNVLQMRAATLGGNMPRFEGPQSDADRQYYLQMAGDLGNPSKTAAEKLEAYKELRRMFSMVDDSGVYDSSKHTQSGRGYPSKYYVSPDGFSSHEN